MDLPYPYARTWKFLKERSTDLLFLAVANLVVIMIVQFAVTFLLLALVVVLLIILIPIVLLTGGLGIVIIPLGLILFFVLYLAVAIVVGGLVNGWYVLMAEEIVGMRYGRRFEFSSLMKKARDRWKELFRRGMGINLFILFIVTPVIATILIIPFGIVFGTAFLLGLEEIIFFPFVINILALALSIPIAPITGFILENGIVRVARGERSWQGMFASVGDMFRRRRLFGYFYLGYLVINILMFILFPLAFIASFVIPIVTKAFIIANDDL